MYDFYQLRNFLKEYYTYAPMCVFMGLGGPVCFYVFGDPRSN